MQRKTVCREGENEVAGNSSDLQFCVFMYQTLEQAESGSASDEEFRLAKKLYDRFHPICKVIYERTEQEVVEFFKLLLRRDG